MRYEAHIDEPSGEPRVISFVADDDEAAKAHANDRWESGGWGTTAKGFALFDAEGRPVDSRKNSNA